jgi:Nickel responsive protein SCO4226-like
MQRYMVERSFSEGLNISVNHEGAAACRMIVLNNAEDGVTWIHSYVSDDRKKSYCIYEAPSPEAIRRAARRNNLSVDRITNVRILDPYFYH